MDVSGEEEEGTNVKKKNRTISGNWPRLNAVIKVTVIIVVMRFIFLLFSVLFSTVLNSNSETQEYFHPPNDIVSPFSAHSSLIIDINNGSMNTLYDVAKSVDVAMVMMYAPWCLHSQMAAKHFVNAAVKFNDTPNVKFIGINCWEVTGSCRSQEGLTVYPRLIAYRAHSKERIEYYGIRSYLEGFVRSLLYTMVYVTSTKQLQDLIVYEESVVVGYFDFSLHSLFPPGYVSYYLASIQAVRVDPLTGSRKSPIYCVISNKELAYNLSFSPSPSIYWISLGYSTERKFTKVHYKGFFSNDKILKWSLSLTKVVKRLAPVGNMSLYPTSAILFIKEPNKSIVSNFNEAAVRITSSYSTTCKGYSHLYFSWSCLSPFLSKSLMSLPLCSNTPNGKCPIFNPLFPNLYYPTHSTTSYCQDDSELGVAYGSWPLPCDLPSLQFYIIDSLQYNGMVQSVGVVTEDMPTLLITDIKNHKVFNFSIDNNTTPQDYISMIESSIKGQSNLVYRSSSPLSPITTATTTTDYCIELNRESFSQILLNDDKVYVVVHYAPWCAVCTHVWPQLMALSQRVNKSLIQLARINGELNDLPSCHIPGYYPSIALYPLRSKHSPIWFPSDRIINVSNILDFINKEGSIDEWIQYSAATTSRSCSQQQWAGEQREEWESMGWLLWETTEKERQSLQKTNQLLNKEIKELRYQITQLQNSDEKRNDMNSLLAQVDYLIGNIMKYNSTSNSAPSNDNIPRPALSDDSTPQSTLSDDSTPSDNRRDNTKEREKGNNFS